MGLAAVGHHRVLPGITAGNLFALSSLIGSGVNLLRPTHEQEDSVIYPEEVADEKVA